MNADGSNEIGLATTAQTERSPVWSPTGTRIAFVSSVAGNDDVYLMNADGSNRLRLTTQVGTDETPSFFYRTNPQ